MNPITIKDLFPDYESFRLATFAKGELRVPTSNVFKTSGQYFDPQGLYDTFIEYYGERFLNYKLDKSRRCFTNTFINIYPKYYYKWKTFVENQLDALSSKAERGNQELSDSVNETQNITNNAISDTPQTNTPPEWDSNTKPSQKNYGKTNAEQTGKTTLDRISLMRDADELLHSIDFNQQLINLIKEFAYLFSALGNSVDANGTACIQDVGEDWWFDNLSLKLVLQEGLGMVARVEGLWDSKNHFIPTDEILNDNGANAVTTGGDGQLELVNGIGTIVEKNITNKTIQENISDEYVTIDQNNVYETNTTQDFTASKIIVPTPTTDTEAVPKKYVDDNLPNDYLISPSGTSLTLTAGTNISFTQVDENLEINSSAVPTTDYVKTNDGTIRKLSNTATTTVNESVTGEIGVDVNPLNTDQIFASSTDNTLGNNQAEINVNTRKRIEAVNDKLFDSVDYGQLIGASPTFDAINSSEAFWAYFGQDKGSQQLCFKDSSETTTPQYFSNENNATDNVLWTSDITKAVYRLNETQPNATELFFVSVLDPNANKYIYNNSNSSFFEEQTSGARINVGRMNLISISPAENNKFYIQNYGNRWIQKYTAATGTPKAVNFAPSDNVPNANAVQIQPTTTAGVDLIPALKLPVPLSNVPNTQYIQITKNGEPISNKIDSSLLAVGTTYNAIAGYSFRIASNILIEVLIGERLGLVANIYSSNKTVKDAITNLNSSEVATTQGSDDILGGAVNDALITLNNKIESNTGLINKRTTYTALPDLPINRPTITIVQDFLTTYDLQASDQWTISNISGSLTYYLTAINVGGEEIPTWNQNRGTFYCQVEAHPTEPDALVLCLRKSDDANYKQYLHVQVVDDVNKTNLYLSPSASTNGTIIRQPADWKGGSLDICIANATYPLLSYEKTTGVGIKRLQYQKGNYGNVPVINKLSGTAQGIKYPSFVVSPAYVNYSTFKFYWKGLPSTEIFNVPITIGQILNFTLNSIACQGQFISRAGGVWFSAIQSPPPDFQIRFQPPMVTQKQIIRTDTGSYIQKVYAPTFTNTNTPEFVVHLTPENAQTGVVATFPTGSTTPISDNWFKVNRILITYDSGANFHNLTAYGIYNTQTNTNNTLESLPNDLHANAKILYRQEGTTTVTGFRFLTDFPLATDWDQIIIYCEWRTEVIPPDNTITNNIN